MINVTNYLKIKTTGSFSRVFTLSTFCILFIKNSFPQTKTKPKPVTTVTKTTTQKDFVMREAMPGSDVVSKAPFTLAFTGMEGWLLASTNTGCRYIFKNADEEAGIATGLTDLGSIKNAITCYKNAYQASKDLGDEVPAQVIVLQDTGFFSGKDEWGIKLQLGKYILNINFKGQFDEVTAEQKKQSGISLAEMVIDRLRYLRKK